MRTSETLALGIWLLLMPWIVAFTPIAQASEAYYVVKDGDTLWGIAARFNVSLEELVEFNNLTEASILSVGAQLIIPGLGGYPGEVDTITVNYGDSLASIRRILQVTKQLLVTLNHLTSPQELYAGANLVVPAEAREPKGSDRAWVEAGSTLLELAAIKNQNPWSLILGNDLPGGWGTLPGDVLTIPGDEVSSPGALPESIEAIAITTPVIQGKTFVMKVQGGSEYILSGSLSSQKLGINPVAGGFVALQGIHAMAEPGFYPLTLEIENPNLGAQPGSTFTFSQLIYMRDGGYPFDPPLSVPAETLDPEITEPEDALWASLGETFTAEKMWQGAFASPVPEEFIDCWTSTFGNRRSYNGSPYNRYHSGLDFCGGAGTELYAPAAGKVVFAGPLTVRGNATVIDHGWGVYTAYAHQAEIFVKPGDLIQAGELIGLGGATGRVTGPHLHWEVWVGGVQVDPAEWLLNTYP
ncbi:MAG TPA: peptidoglycan DD-metalloendopeptidase family protein [Anaerolineales bacterium]|nr:peptidoglycan DD-metalloendopeptidase family protein [Anaerolineales bacterium]